MSVSQPSSLSSLLAKTAQAAQANPEVAAFHAQVELNKEALVARIERLTELEGVSLKTEMDDLREALLHDTAAAALLPPQSIQALVVHIRKIQGKLIEANASKVKAPKEAKPKEPKKKAATVAELLAMAKQMENEDDLF